MAALLRYEPSWLPRDLAAGLSVAAIALPVGIAYAELAGVPAAIGIYAAIFPLVPYALLGSSRQLILGPDAATCIMVAASLGPLAHGDPARYLALLPVLTLITGALYVVAALARLGFFANFLSQPILTGYLNGVATVIIVGQLPKLLGYPSEADEVLPRLLELVERADQSHLAAAALGLVLLAGLVALRRFAPALPAPLLAVAAGIAAVAALDLGSRGVALAGPVPAGLPALSWTWFDAPTYRSLFGDAAGILLISFTSGVLTAKSFARRNRYEIDANQELLALGAANLAVGLGQGFPVTGADSRTAVNDAVGGRTQLAAIVAAGAMLLVLLTLTGPLALVPTTALAAVILVSAAGLFDIAGLRLLLAMSRREGLMSIATTVGVLALGVLPGVVLAVVLSLFWLLATAMRPKDAVLGRLPGLSGFHSIGRLPPGRNHPGPAALPLQRQPALLQHRLFLRAGAGRDPGCRVAGRLGRRRSQPDQPCRRDRRAAVRRTARGAGSARGHPGDGARETPAGRQVRDAMGGGAPRTRGGPRFPDPAVRRPGVRGSKGVREAPKRQSR